MASFNNCLDRVKELHGFKTEVALAEFLGISKSYLHEMRKNGNASDDLCDRIAVTIGAHPIIVRGERDALKKGGKSAELWADFVRRIAVFTVAGVMVMGSDNTSTQVPESDTKDYRKFRIPFLFKALRRFFKFSSDNQAKTACPTLATRCSMVSCTS